MRKNLLSVLLLTCLATVSVRADLIWYEGFNYPDGNITNVSSGLWVCPGGNNGNGTDMLCSAHSLQVSTTSSTVASRSSDDYRFLSVTNGSTFTNHVQVLYASFTVICTNLPNGAGSYFGGFYGTAGTGGGYFGRLQAFTNGTVLPKTWRLGVTDNNLSTNKADGGFPVDLALNTPYQVVEELDPITLIATTIWVNPIDPTDTGSSSTDRKYTANDPLGGAATTPVTTYAFRQASSFGNGFWIITNLVTATTFAEAATNIWNTNAVAPTIVYQPTVGITNFINNSITLSAVANGQALGNLTYQWFQGSNPYPTGNGANILTIPNAQASDSGDYTLVVTTPFGLSVTSSVAHVVISAAPVPPSFAPGGQPVSQTVYGGQTVIFSTTVTSPGNVTFTWYSNNVVITSGTQTSGDTSTLELDNVQGNFSGSAYKVAATNDVVTTSGIVSTNAVLTVLNTPVVSIAYLRTLVDPGTYQPTNSTTPYQVTGTITIFTNLTSGNTAGYYLQDATAGINIFATFGSTFRPAQGDVVTFTGVLSYFSSTGLELYADTVDAPFANYTSYTDTGTTNALPTPVIIPFSVTNNLAYVNTNLAGSLVTLKNVYFSTNAGKTISTTGNQAVTVTNASGQTFALQFFNLDLDTAGQTLPTFAYSVTGILYGGNPNFSVGVTRFADIVTTAPLSPIPLSLSYSGGNLVFNWNDNSFSLQSSTNVVGPYTTITGAASGFITNTTAASTMFFRLYHP